MVLGAHSQPGAPRLKQIQAVEDQVIQYIPQESTTSASVALVARERSAAIDESEFLHQNIEVPYRRVLAGEFQQPFTERGAQRRAATVCNGSRSVDESSIGSECNPPNGALELLPVTRACTLFAPGRRSTRGPGLRLRPCRGGLRRRGGRGKRSRSGGRRRGARGWRGRRGCRR